MCAPLSPYMLPSPGMCRRSRHPHYRGATARDILTTAAPPLETSSQTGQEEEGGLQVLVRLLTPHVLDPLCQGPDPAAP